MHWRVSKHLASAAVATLEMTVRCHPTVALARTAAARVCACPTLRLLLAIAASGKRSCAVVLIFLSLNLLSSRVFTLSRLTSFSSSPSFYFLLSLLNLSFSFLLVSRGSLELIAARSQLALETRAVEMETVFLAQINACATAVFLVVSVKTIVLSRMEQSAVGTAPVTMGLWALEFARVRVDIFKMIALCRRILARLASAQDMEHVRQSTRMLVSRAPAQTGIQELRVPLPLMHATVKIVIKVHVHCRARVLDGSVTARQDGVVLPARTVPLHTLVVLVLRYAQVDLRTLAVGTGTVQTVRQVVDCAPAHPGALAIIARLKIHATVCPLTLATERQAAVVGGVLMEMITTTDAARV